jgi:hypothetical protein
VLSFEFPDRLKAIFDVVVFGSHEILMLPAGFARTPDNEIVAVAVAVLSVDCALAITVLPSQSLQEY